MATVDEKMPVETGEQAVPQTPQKSSEYSSDAPIDPKAESRLVRKLDFIIFPTFFVIYMMSFLDRINISNARIQGLVTELDLVGTRFNVALFVSPQRMKARYSITEIDSCTDLLHLLHSSGSTFQHAHQKIPAFPVPVFFDVLLGYYQYVHGIRPFLRCPPWSSIPPRYFRSRPPPWHHLRYIAVL